MKDLCDIFELNRLIKDSTCLKRSNPSCIDNFCSNKMSMFFNSSTVETGISDHHRFFVQYFARHFVKVHQKLYTIGLITTIIKNSVKMF